MESNTELESKSTRLADKLRKKSQSATERADKLEWDGRFKTKGKLKRFLGSGKWNPILYANNRLREGIGKESIPNYYDHKIGKLRTKSEIYRIKADHISPQSDKTEDLE